MTDFARLVYRAGAVLWIVAFVVVITPTKERQ